jgi:hypothetical protein
MGGLQDKLKKLEVDVGGEVLKIVTNASNVKEPRHISGFRFCELLLDESVTVASWWKQRYNYPYTETA